MLSSMRDIECAKTELKGHSIVCICGEKRIFSDERGIRPLLALIDERQNLRGYSVADKIVGKAAALLFALLQTAEIFADVLSIGGEEVLRRFHIPYSYGVKVDHIINRAGTDICPMEQTVEKIDDAQEALMALREKVNQLRADPTKK